jgi:hypothetical protein
MDYRPLCKICGHKHYSYEPHIWDDEKKPIPRATTVGPPVIAKEVVVPVVTQTKDVTQSVTQKLSNAERVKAWRKRNPEKSRKAQLKYYYAKKDAGSHTE